MKAVQFKTNIMCGSCIAKVSPALNAALGEGNWNVDLSNPTKLLTVSTDKADEVAIIHLLGEAGYKAEYVNDI